MKKKYKYIILIVIGLIIVGSLFYTLVIGTNSKDKEQAKRWYENNLTTNSILTMRTIGKGCNSRHVYFYNKKAIIAD